MVRETPDNYSNNWRVDFWSTMCLHPCQWCVSCMFPCCMAYHQRNLLLDGDLTQYSCCQGVYGCKCTCWRTCPQLGLCLEVSLCTWCSVAANRIMIQDRWRIQNTKCENAILCMACICSWVICISSFFVNIPLEAECAIECIYCSLLGCLNTQQEIELKYRLADAENGIEMDPYA
mmetsp:Transcript_15132/g.22670  ORF Transcript_15132/g.22670 Transcript_15132/m.22670 type:complete len:175 (+) Transcript_15132:32-556(+)